MNLYFLVEGDETEKRVYRAWVKHVFPSLTLVQSVDEMIADSYFILAGHGYPSYMRRIRDAFLDLKDHPAVQHFFLCIDAEEVSYEERLREVQDEVTRAESETRVRDGNPSLQVHLIVQQCCIETWFLGHTRMMRRNPASPELSAYKRFFDVREDDPEEMTALDGFPTKAAFHLEYLRAMLREQNPNLRYTKTRPGVVMERDYLDALRERCASTGHLASLQRLFTAWEGIAPPSSIGTSSSP